jgi:DnaK suppressor protein
MARTHEAIEAALTAQLKSERARLLRELRLLDQAERALGASQADEGDAGGEMADVASDLVEEELDASLAAAARERLMEVEAALLRVAEGTFGRCLRCGRPIAIARLRALPWTPYCRRCAGSFATDQPPADAPAGLIAHLR